MTKKDKKNSGFTLVETLVAISIFTMSILALLSILSQGISNTNYAKRKIIASYLAQEGIEYMRNMRDTFVLYDGTSSQNGWTNFNNKLVNVSCPTNGCYFDDQNLDYNSHSQQMVSVATLFDCNASCPTLLYDANTGSYNYNISGVDSGFIRKIKVTQINADETKVLSTVYFTQGSGNYNITFSEDLFNWVE